MNNRYFKLLGAAAGLLLSASLAYGQAVPVPMVPSIGASDVFQDIVNGQPQANSYYATAAQMGSYGATLPGGNNENALVGGDFTTNLFGHGTSVALASSTYYVAYGANNWFSWGGTSTPATITQQTGASDITADYGASLRVNKGSLTGTAQICTSQVVETANSLRFQGQTAEFDFHAKAGSTFSAASSNLAVYISTGTGTDEGSVKMAYGLNAAGGGGTTAWTGQVNLGGTAGYLIPISTTWARYSVAAPIPATATEIGVSICYTPVGTGSATDWFEFTGAQLVPNQALAGVASTAGVVLGVNDVRAKSFYRRPAGLEAALQQRSLYTISESVTSGAQQSASGQGASTTTCSLYFPFPVLMRAIPTFVAEGTALTTTTWTITHVVTATALASTYLVLLGANTPNGGALTGTVASGLTAGQTCVLTSANGGSRLTWSAEL